MLKSDLFDKPHNGKLPFLQKSICSSMGITFLVFNWTEVSKKRPSADLAMIKLALVILFVSGCPDVFFEEPSILSLLKSGGGELDLQERIDNNEKNENKIIREIIYKLFLLSLLGFNYKLPR